MGFTSDGASVNQRDKGSIKMILSEKSLVFVWCIVHRLELALTDTEFKEIDMLLRPKEIMRITRKV